MSNDTGLSMEERVSSLFQPDTLLPDQYFETFRRKFHLEPEKKLMLAILEDAVACFQKYIFASDSKGKALFREAEEWIEGRNVEGIFSFDSVCELPQLAQPKVYRLESRQRKSRRGVSISGRSHRRLRRAVSR
jgi:hypothetical protein